MKRTVFLLALLTAWSGTFAQSLEEFMKPLPAAVCQEAPMPEQMAQKFERLKKERSDKYLSSSSAHLPATDRAVLQKKEQYLMPAEKGFQVRPQDGSSFAVCIPELKLVNTSHGREAVKKGEGKFNPKKDRISYAVIEDGDRISIINHDHRRVDMTEFRLSTSDEAVKMEENRIVFVAPLLEIAAGKHPWQYKIKCEHVASGAQYSFDLKLVWTQRVNHSGELHALAFTPYASEAAKNLGLLFDLDNKRLHIVQLPFHIDADGKNGKDGRRGHSGASGRNSKTYKDDEGNTKTTPGTCGEPGENGKDGQDGTDGGRFLICVSPELVEAYGLDGVIATIDAGLGGKGGKGGEGGKHGTGSGCNGKAANGKDGKDGKDGQRGDFLYVLTDVNGLYNTIML